MITRLTIKNFKALTDFDISCRQLNLFTGVNSSGKSTVLQTLLLLRQSFKGGFFQQEGSPLWLGGKDSLTTLGTFKDVMSATASRDDERIYLDITATEGNLHFKSVLYTPDNRTANWIDGELSPHWLKLKDFPLFSSDFQYLAAERIAPEEDYPRFSSSDYSLGKDGSLTPHYLERFGNIDIAIPALAQKLANKSMTLIDQVNAWMSKISANIEVLTKENLSTNRIELSFRYKRSDGVPSQDYKPYNVGFGITHTLPVVVAILSAKPGDILIIENPETHLHPRGQSKLGELIAIAAKYGVQLFVETHSDHIINGLRIAMNKQILVTSEALVYYFEKDDNDVTGWIPIEIDENGGLSKWPDGFFDEWDKSLNELL